VQLFRNCLYFSNALSVENSESKHRRLMSITGIMVKKSNATIAIIKVTAKSEEKLFSYLEVVWD
jgi:hypothetical protein